MVNPSPQTMWCSRSTGSFFNEDVRTDYRDVLLVEDKLPTCEKVDDYTVRFTLAAPFRPFLR